MKKRLIVMALVITRCLFGNVLIAQSIDPVSLIISKAIKAIDLKVQKLQNETIWLEQAQVVTENALSKAKLSEITGWQQQLSDLYTGYFAELKNVKGSVKGLRQVQRVFEMQHELVTEYGRFAKDVHSKPAYDELLNTSMEIVQTLYSVLSSAYSMKDAERLCMVTTLKAAMSHCLDNIRSLNKQQVQAAILQARTAADLKLVKQLNGIQ